MTDEHIAKLLCPQIVTLWPDSWWQACDFSLFSSLSFASLLSVWKQGESHRRNLQGRRRNHQSLGRSQQNQERILACQIRYQNNIFSFPKFVIYYKLLCTENVFHPLNMNFYNLKVWGLLLKLAKLGKGTKAYTEVQINFFLSFDILTQATLILIVSNITHTQNQI